jgi:hypothetical protein
MSEDLRRAEGQRLHTTRLVTSGSLSQPQQAVFTPEKQCHMGRPSFTRQGQHCSVDGDPFVKEN